jgi:micrococcal nuclease
MPSPFSAVAGVPLLWAAVLFLCISAPAQPPVINAKVVGVVDGDTIVIEDRKRRKYRLRLKNIDAPELAQNYGPRAKEHLSAILMGAGVRIVSNHYDKEGNLVGQVLRKRQDVALEMVLGGLAWHLTGFAHGQSAEEQRFYQAAEQNAKRLRFNIWSDPKAVPPWEFRTRAGSSAFR